MHNSQHLKPVIIVVGGMYGSESKGLVAADLAVEKNAAYCVRTGSINAGHTVQYKDKFYVNQLIPVGWVNPNSKLVLGAGVYIDPVLLETEVKMINEAMPEADVRERLFIDNRCAVHLEKHYNEEHHSGIHEKMGSTGHGVMAAIVDKMKRDRDYKLFRDLPEAKFYKVVDTVRMLNEAYDKSEQILLEGTQGTLLDFHLSHYPFCTTRQTVAGNWLSECGLSPAVLTEIHMVIRTYPIRVAGNSGPMGKHELRWVELARMVNEKLIASGKEPIVNPELVEKFDRLETEYIKNNLLTQEGKENLPVEYTKWDNQQRWENNTFLSNLHNEVLKLFTPEEIIELKKFFEITTVTKKLRRIAEIDHDELGYAVMLNRPTHLDVNFLNYMFPSTYGYTTEAELQADPNWPVIQKWLVELADRHKVCINRVNCSPKNTIQISPIGVQYL